MKKTVLVLGATGRFGRSCCTAFADKGWHVTGVSRNGKPANIVSDDWIEADILDEAAQAAFDGRRYDVIVHGLNPLYHQWAELMPRQTAAVIALAQEMNAQVLLPLNVYNYGKNIPPVLSETTPHRPDHKKAALRIEFEQSFKHAARNGLSIVALRMGDFIEGRDSGNWFETHMINKIEKNVFTYPGPRDKVHAWAFLPDAARAGVELVEQSGQQTGYSEYCFEGWSLTGDELKAELENATGRSLKDKSIPWPLFRLAGLFSPLVREVIAMRYLWQRSHQMDGGKLRTALPDYKDTPPKTAFKDIL